MPVGTAWLGGKIPPTRPFGAERLPEPPPRPREKPRAAPICGRCFWGFPEWNTTRPGIPAAPRCLTGSVCLSTKANISFPTPPTKRWMAARASYKLLQPSCRGSAPEAGCKPSVRACHSVTGQNRPAGEKSGAANNAGNKPGGDFVPFALLVKINSPFRFPSF